MHDVLVRDGKFDAGLHEIVADGDFSAETITTARDVEFFEVIGIGLYEDGDMDTGELQCVGDAFFVTEVGKNDQHTVEFVAMFLEKIGTFAGIGMGFDAAELGILLTELDGAYAVGRKDFCNIRPRFSDKVVGEEIAVAVDDTENRGLVGAIFHTFLRGAKSLLVFAADTSAF